MSAKATFWAWEQGINSSCKLVLLCLSDCYNEDTKRCDPGPTYISQKTGLNVKTIRLAIKNLAEIGLISVGKRAGKTPNYGLKINVNLTSKPYPKSGIPNINPTQKRVYPNTDLTLPKNGYQT